MPEEVERTDQEKRARRRRLTLLLIPIVAVTISANVMHFLAPALIKDHPLVVIAFEPINRWLVLAVNRVSTFEFFAVSFVRLLLTDPIYFLLGHWFGDGALDWIENKTGNSGMVPFIKKWFGRAGPVVVFIAPNPYVCLLAGASNMSVRLFVSLNVAGTLVRLVIIKLTGNALEPVLEPVLNFIQRYRWQLVVISVVIFAIQSISNRKKGKKGDLESVGQMADELEASIEAAENES